MGCGASSAAYATPPSHHHHDDDPAPTSTMSDRKHHQLKTAATTTVTEKEDEEAVNKKKKKGPAPGMEFISVLTDQEREQAQLRCLRTSDTCLSRGGGLQVPPISAKIRIRPDLAA